MMSIIKLKNVPKIKLIDLLRRRKTTLIKHLNEFGITTYEHLVERCDRMGVVPPSQEEFNQISPQPPTVNSPAEGVVVLDLPPIVIESTGKKYEEDIDYNDGESVTENEVENTENSFKKKSKRKRENSLHE